jgi:hypothetical protein
VVPAVNVSGGAFQRVLVERTVQPPAQLAGDLSRHVHGLHRRQPDHPVAV